MAKIIHTTKVCDQGHYGSSDSHCSECHKRLGKKTWHLLKKCPKCGAIFNEKMQFEAGPDFGNYDSDRY